MTTSLNHVHPWILVGPFLLALAACPPKDQPGTTDEAEDTTSDASASTTTSDASASTTTSSGSPSTPTGETTASEPDPTSTTAPSEPDTTSSNSTATTAPPEPNTTSTSTTLDPDTTSASSTSTTLDPDTTTTGDACTADLIVSLAVGFDKCEEDLILVVTLQNVGTDDAPAGIGVTFFEGTDASGLKLGTKPTMKPVPAGSSTAVTWTAAAPPPGESSDFYVEISIADCDESNNSDFVTDAACPG